MTRFVYILSNSTTKVAGNMMSGLCEVCNENVSKYKCSTCFSPYCSLACWKKHKNENECKVKEKVQGNAVNRTDKKKYFTEDTISDETLSQLGDSKKLKAILSNKYLQSLLVAVDDASNPEDAIKQAMKNPEFVEFVDECLKIVEDSCDQISQEGI